ncbi:Immunity protein 17 [Aquimarina amphilecti]|uniref:Immunity protein 17 n=1 Tax=Aquimarina amphilecti TaxID=1038014 RepID=A0A1H7QN07_AQUAM|nr:immunity 17 family protein [Aquimarina amphilecti]SEL49005.1 Immunity protein 17 [Aquimarina amphilecti]
MEKILNNVKDFFTEFPEFIYLIIGIVFLVLFIGTVKNKNWAIDPESGNQRMFYNMFGHKTFRVFIGVVYILGTVAGFCGFFMYFTKK